MPVFKGKATLEEGEWQVVTGESMEDMRFFKVEVALPYGAARCTTARRLT